MFSSKGARTFLASLLPFLMLSAFLLPVAGVRHIWQDEVETAERARSILAYGVPKVVDPEGRVSVNAGGREIEDGDVHRYTPWGQFYVAALGIAGGRLLGVSDDASVRSPFILAHAATSSVLTFGLMSVCAWPATVSIAAGTLFGLQTVRVLNNRSCRYHALLDLLFAGGLLAIGLRRSNRRPSVYLSAICIFLLPQMHTLGGGLLASTLVVAAILRELFVENVESLKWPRVLNSIRREVFPSVIPALTSVLVVAVLCRPWRQGAWGKLSLDRVWNSLGSTLEISYSFYAFGIFALFLLWRRSYRTFFYLVVVAISIRLTVRVLDFHPFSQVRYYFAVPIFFVFWFITTGWPPEFSRKRSVWIVLVLVSILLPEAQGIVRPGQGVRVVVNDYRMRWRGDQQPLMKAFDEIRSNGGESQAVFFEYVPQLVNWYMRSAESTVLDEPSVHTELNSSNPLFSKLQQKPEWHLFYKEQNGYWTCFPKCHFHRTEILNGKYDLVIEIANHAEGAAIPFCVIDRWKTNRWNNAPFVAYNLEARRPEGPINDELILARRCLKSSD